MCTQKPPRLNAHNAITFKPLGHIWDYPLSNWDFCWVVKSGVGQVDCKKLHDGLQYACSRLSWALKPMCFSLRGSQGILFKRFCPPDEHHLYFMLWKIYISILFNFPYSDLKYSVSALAKACIYVCTAPAELSSWNKVKESSGLESECMTCSLNTLRTIYLLSEWLSGSTPHPSCVQPSQDPFAIAAGCFLAGEIRHRPKSSIPIMEDISSLGNSCFLSCVSCSDGGWSIECWLNDFTHSSDSRCSRWKALDWILLMLFILRSLEREQGWASVSKYQSVQKTFKVREDLWDCKCLGRIFHEAIHHPE